MLSDGFGAFGDGDVVVVDVAVAAVAAARRDGRQRLALRRSRVVVGGRGTVGVEMGEYW